MPSYRYRAFAPDGRAVDGSVEAQSRQAAIELLHRRGQFPFDVVESAAAAGPRWWEREVFPRRALPASSLAILIRELATLVAAELPIDEALRILAGQPLLSARTRGLVRGLLARVTEGQSLSEAMAGADGAFPAFTWQIVKAGEASGTLGPALGDLALSLERAEKVREAVRAATLYPLVLLGVATAALTLILFVLIPALEPLFKGVGAELPLVLRLLDGGREAIVGHPLTVLLLAVLAGIGITMLRRTPWWRGLCDGAALRLPGLGPLVAYRETGRFARTLATLLRSGVPLIDTLAVGAGVMANSRFAAAVEMARERVRQGSGLAAALAESGRFPETAVRLVSVGERSGELEAMAARVADIYEAAFARGVERMTTLLAPLLTMLIGGLVGGLILSVISATLGINELAWR
jgi:general secretion pathway protein F